MGDGTTARVRVSWGDDRELTREVAALTVSDHDRMIDEVRFICSDGLTIGGEGIANGTRIGVELGWGDELTKIFVGTVEQVSGAAKGAQGSVTVVARDPSAAMHEGSTSLGATAGMTLSAIVEKLVAKYSKNFEVGKIEPDPNPTFQRALPALVDRTPYRYLQELASTYGARAFVEVNDGKAKFYFKSIQSLWRAEPLGHLNWCRGLGNVDQFKYERVAARAARQLVSTTVDPETGELATLDSGVPPTTLTPPRSMPSAGGDKRLQASATSASTARAETEQARSLSASVGHLYGLPNDPDKARALVSFDPTAVSGYRAWAVVSGHPNLRAKGRVEVTGIAPWAEGDWWVKGATHRFTRTPDAGRTGGRWKTQLELTR